MLCVCVCVCVCVFGLKPLTFPLRRWLASVVERACSVADFGGQPANHVLINRYRPGARHATNCRPALHADFYEGEGILPHEDGPLYHPCACIVSLQSPALMTFHRKSAEGECTAGAGRSSSRPCSCCARAGPAQRACSVLLMPRSLLKIDGAHYTEFLHGIEAVRN